jgi:hypothetical protein
MSALIVISATARVINDDNRPGRSTHRRGSCTHSSRVRSKKTLDPVLSAEPVIAVSTDGDGRRSIGFAGRVAWVDISDRRA